jgi:hypothetical protein
MICQPPYKQLNAPVLKCLEHDLRQRSVEATLHEILLTAETQGCSDELARGIVGALLLKSFGNDICISPSSPDEFLVGDAIIKVAVKWLNHQQYEELKQRTSSSKKEVWLLTRSDRWVGWRDAVKGSNDIPPGRVVVRSVESFVGQNITKLAGFSAVGKVSQLKELFELYNTRWIAKVGTPGIRIIMK